MKKFEISADSTCDFYCQEIKDCCIDVAPLDYVVTKGDDLVEERDCYKSMDEYVDFYRRLKNGCLAKTSILNVQAHVDLFTSMAKRGIKQALHISQGYGLSPTVDNANAAIEIVKKDFPDIDYVAVESNTTTYGEGMLVKAAIKMRDEGKTKEEALEVINKIKHFVQHFILVNDLKFLARGGRIGAASASIGSLLQVKPMIQFDKQGKLKIVKKEIGLKKALSSIVSDYGKFTLNEEFPYMCIVHTDNEPLAKQLQDMLKEKYNIEPEIRIMGPIIGAHVGPGAVALTFISNEERPY